MNDATGGGGVEMPVIAVTSDLAATARDKAASRFTPRAVLTLFLFFSFFLH